MAKRITTESYIHRARSVHGDKYDYSECFYKNPSTKVDVICKQHGKFSVLPSNHVRRKSGCPLCARENISKAKDFEYYMEKYKHKLRSGFEYLDFYNKDHKLYVVYNCPKHGERTQDLANHINNQHGCASCASEHVSSCRRHTLEDILKLFKEKFGDKFDYSYVKYVSYNHPVKIICPTHGEFTQKPVDHIGSKYGCFECARNFKAKSNRGGKYDRESFISAAKSAHGERYNYDKVVYENLTKHITVTCKVHGDFQVVPKVHLKGKNCRRCAMEASGKKSRKWNTQHFIEKAKEVHGDRFDYREVECEKRTDLVKIICKKHGPFFQLVSNHIAGKNGCKVCYDERNAKQYFQQYDYSHIYLLKITHGDECYLKVGMSVNPDHRAYEISNELGNNTKVEILESIGDYSKRVWLFEKRIHETNLLTKYTPSVSFGGFTECYTLDNLELLTKWFNKFGGSIGKGKENTKFWSSFD